MKLEISLQTDIIQFYSSWFGNRLKKGFFSKQDENGAEERYYFSDFQSIRIWTRNPANLIPKIEKLKQFNKPIEIVIELSFYDKMYNGNEEELHKVFDKVDRLLNHVPLSCISFCYSPIFSDGLRDSSFHNERIRLLLEYKKVKNFYYYFEEKENLSNPKLPIFILEEDEKQKILSFMNDYSLIHKTNFMPKPSIQEIDVDMGLKNACLSTAHFSRNTLPREQMEIQFSKHSPNSNFLLQDISLMIKGKSKKTVKKEENDINTLQSKLVNLLKVVNIWEKQ